MKKLLAITFLCFLASGCREDSASEKVMKFINTGDISLLSKSKLSVCSDSEIHKLLDEMGTPAKNRLSTTSDYYSVSKYLFSKLNYKIVSSVKDGNKELITVKVIYPKALRDAGGFFDAEEASAKYMTEERKKGLDNLNALYKSGKLDDLEYDGNNINFTVLNDGIDLSIPVDKCMAK